MKSFLPHQMANNMEKELLSILGKSFKLNGYMPQIPDIAGIMHISKYKVKQLLDVLVESKELTRNYNKYYLNNQGELTTPLEPVHAPISVEEKTTRKRPQRTQEEWSILIIRITMGIIGIAAAYMSIYYTWEWLLDFLPAFQALVLSGATVAFSVIAFETIIIFIQQKRKWIAGVFVFVWFIVMIFSITSTVAGLYNRRIEKMQSILSKSSTNSYKLAEYNLYNVDETQLTQRIDDSRKEFELLRKEWMKNPTNTGNIYTTMKRTERNMDALLDELKKNRGEKIRFLQSAKSAGITSETAIEIPNFYGWVAKIFKTTADLVEFWLSLFPAIFIDVIAPLSLAVFMFLGKEPKKKEED